MSKTLELRPHLSEKSYSLSEKGVYVLRVPPSSSKQAVKAAVEAQYGVTVRAIRAVSSKGKTKRTVRKRSRPVLGTRVDTKKMYVTLKTGDRLPIFAETK